MNINSSDTNPFEKLTGSSILANTKAIAILLTIVTLIALLLAKMQIMGAGLVFALLFGLIFLYLLFQNPIIGYYTAIGLNFILLGLNRYIVGLPLGFGIDGILLLTLLALIFSRFRDRVDWSPANKDITILAALWLGYCLLQLVNPEAQSVEAWITGRGIGFYFFFFVVLTLLFINTGRKLDTLLYVWGVFTIIGTLKGIVQLYIGVDAAEQAWLDEGAAQTHVLFGKLRVFSFFSDAGQFGANQGFSAVVAIIYSMSKRGFAKVFFILVGLFGIYGMMISGTRGAISVPLVGFMTFFVLRRNLKVLAFGVFILAIVFVFFKYTTIANGNDQIRRMRTAFDPNDASLHVRLDNQKLFKTYLATRPFGGGLGHAGDKAKRFLPNAFLSNVATDSWYVQIWAELGVVGLIFHLGILFYVMAKASFQVMFRIRDPDLKLKISALIAGMAGIMVASYGNPILGQMPTALLFYAGMAIISNTAVLDNEATEPVSKLQHKFIN